MNLQQKPTLVNAIAWMTLASGIVNLFWGFAALSALWWTIICIPFLILPTALGIFEIIYAAKLFSNPPQAVNPSTNIAVLEIACIVTGNVFSMAVGILSLVFYNDTVVRDYFARLNGTPVPVAPAPMTEPASNPGPEPAPVEESVPAPEAESPAPPAEAAPSKPKRSPRKMA